MSNKEAVKKLIKECLIEILAEGLMADSFPSKNAAAAKKKTETFQNKKPKTIFDQLDEVRSGQKQTNHPNLMKQRITDSVRVATNDPILQSILAETAKTTLQEQLQYEQQIPRVPQIDHTSFYSQSTQASQARPQSKNPQPSIFQQEETSDFEISHSPAAGLDISSLFGDATKNWEEVLQRADKKLP